MESSTESISNQIVVMNFDDLINKLSAEYDVLGPWIEFENLSENAYLDICDYLPKSTIVHVHADVKPNLWSQYTPNYSLNHQYSWGEINFNCGRNPCITIYEGKYDPIKEKIDCINDANLSHEFKQAANSIIAALEIQEQSICDLLNIKKPLVCEKYSIRNRDASGHIKFEVEINSSLIEKCATDIFSKVGPGTNAYVTTIFHAFQKYNILPNALNIKLSTTCASPNSDTQELFKFEKWESCFLNLGNDYERFIFKLLILKKAVKNNSPVYRFDLNRSKDGHYYSLENVSAIRAKSGEKKELNEVLKHFSKELATQIQINKCNYNEITLHVADTSSNNCTADEIISAIATKILENDSECIEIAANSQDNKMAVQYFKNRGYVVLQSKHLAEYLINYLKKSKLHAFY